MSNQCIVTEAAYPEGWFRHGNVFSFSYDWQLPAKTELEAYENIVVNSVQDVKVQYVCFPWASLIDYIDYRPSKAEYLLRAIENRPPRIGLKVITFCQHIFALKLMPYFKLFGITDIYWSHKTESLDYIEGIKIHPYQLYPVMYHKEKNLKNKPLSKRKYLYSFIGAYQKDFYLSEIRKLIFELPKYEHSIVVERSEWHFQQDVYRNQVRGETEGETRKQVRKWYETEYIDAMRDTVFCLCPSGTGPNTIRLWEAIKFGCTPVILSDSFDTSLLKQMGINYIKVCENKEDLESFIDKITKQYPRMYNEIREYI